MKSITNQLIIYSIAMISFFNNANAQNKVYDEKGGNKKIVSEYHKIRFEESIKSPKIKSNLKGEEAGGAIVASLAATGLDIVFKSVESILKNNVKKYSAEYVSTGVYQNMVSRYVPDIIFEYQAKTDSKASEEIKLSIIFEAIQVKNINEQVDENGKLKLIESDENPLPIVYYRVKKYKLTGTKAKTKTNWNKIDYTIELKPVLYLTTVITDEKTKIKKSNISEKKEFELSPILFKNVSFTDDFVKIPNDKNYITNSFNLPEGAFFGEVNLKITETNPYKIKAEKLLEHFNDHKDSAKTIINNFLPKADEEKDESDGDGDDNEDNAGTPVSKDEGK